MKRSLVEHLREPVTGARLSLVVADPAEGEVAAGVLRTEAHHAQQLEHRLLGHCEELVRGHADELVSQQ